MKKEYITVKEAALELRVHELTIYRWIKEGKLQSVKVGQKNVRIEREELNKIIK